MGKDQHSAPWRETSQPEVVAMPRPHDGLRRALIGSFRSIPALPDEFVRLLSRLR